MQYPNSLDVTSKMVHNIEMPQGENLPSAPEPLSIGRTIDVLTDPGKMVTLLAIGTFSPRESITPTERSATFAGVAERSNNLQGPYQSRDVKIANVKSHCQMLATAGLIDFDLELVPGSSRPAYVLRQSKKGAGIGVAIAGAMGGLQLEVPEEGFLERAMNIRADTARDNPRPRIYEKLLNGPASIMEIAKAAEISPARTTHFVQRLCDDDVLSHRSFTGPENRRYFLAAGDFPTTTKVTRLAGYVLEAAKTLRTRDHQIVSGKDLLDEVGRMKPQAPRDAVWHALLVWHWYEPHRKGLIRPVDEIRSAQSEVDILPSLKPYIEKMLEIRRLLAGDDKKARDFQAQARSDAAQIIDSSELVAQLLSFRSGYATKTGAGNWPKAAESVYFSRVAAGELKVSLDELHQLTMEWTGKRISMKHFQARLMESPALLLRYQPGQTRNTRLSKYVIAKNIVVSMNWSKAACKDEDPELFFPLNNTDPFVPQANKAKRICESCPIKIPCLKLALEEERPSGIRGGIWLDRPEELTPNLRTQLSFVTVKDQ